VRPFAYRSEPGVVRSAPVSSSIFNPDRGRAMKADHYRDHGDDIGWFSLSADHRDIMADRMPSRDELAAEGIL